MGKSNLANSQMKQRVDAGFWPIPPFLRGLGGFKSLLIVKIYQP